VTYQLRVPARRLEHFKGNSRLPDPARIVQLDWAVRLGRLQFPRPGGEQRRPTNQCQALVFPAPG